MNSCLHLARAIECARATLAIDPAQANAAKLLAEAEREQARLDKLTKIKRKAKRKVRDDEFYRDDSL